ncbi:MAG: hypothetical protein ACXVLQ_06900 [Bacteriovorax sp.]
MGARRPQQKPAPTPMPVPTPTPVPTPVPTPAPNDTVYVERIKELVNGSSCAQYSWKNRGRAPTGYVKGVALSFARSFCRLKKSENNPSKMMTIMSGANSFDTKKDALAHYQSQFVKLPLSLKVAGAEPLRALYVLGMGLGMRESSGSYCEGWDLSAGANRTSSEAEAGLFQTSYDSMIISPELRNLYTEYKSTNNNRCFLNVFKEGVRCGPSTILGIGDGADYQVFNKTCPAFATEYAMMMLRLQRTHYGPINRKEAEVNPACNQLLLNVQELIETDPQNACDDIF